MDPKMTIYAVHDHGKVVNVACQWVARHRKLALRIFTVPVVIMTIIYMIFFMLVDDDLYGVLYLCLAACLLIPVLPTLMMHIVENGELYDYPRRIPRVGEILRPWAKYTWDYVQIFFIFLVFSIITAITFVGPIILLTILPLALAIKNREELNAVECTFKAFKYIFQNLVTYLLMLLGLGIIVVSLSAAPSVLIYELGDFFKTFISREVYHTLCDFVHYDFFTFLVVVSGCVGSITSSMIIYITYHFFYGHCKENADHPSLLRRIKEFDGTTSNES